MQIKNEISPICLVALEDIVVQLVQYMGTISDEMYAAPLSIIGGNTIGKHIRHILECMEALENGYENGVVNYDARLRLTVYETQVSATQHKLLELLESLETKSDKPLQLYGDYSATGNHSEHNNTSFYREIAYNVEHAIHHMAIIKIASLQAYPEIPLASNFGLAYSTIRFQNS